MSHASAYPKLEFSSSRFSAIMGAQLRTLPLTPRYPITVKYKKFKHLKKDRNPPSPSCYREAQPSRTAARLIVVEIPNRHKGPTQRSQQSSLKN